MVSTNLTEFPRPVLVSRFTHYFRNSTYQNQLDVSITVGVLCLALCSFLVSSWQGTQRVRRNLIEQGEHITESLARQSVLALLTGSSDNAVEAVNTTQTFPGVVKLGIYDSNNRVLLVQGVADNLLTYATPNIIGRKAGLYSETDNEWTFSAPVYSRHPDDSPFQAQPVKPEWLGYVVVVMSKETLIHMTRDLFFANLVTSFSFALLFLFLIHRLTRRMIRPLEQLSIAMACAEAGEEGVRATPSGPSDIAAMAHSFNNMMDVLEERKTELRATRDKALAFARLKAEFAAVVSHEVRTPMSGVIGMLNILKETKLPRQQREFVNVAWGSANALLDLINDILDFSKLEAGKLVLEQVEFSPRQLTEEVIDLFSIGAHQKGLELGYLASPLVPTRVRGDPQRLRQILSNLIGNAVKFTHQGEVAITIEAIGDVTRIAGVVDPNTNQTSDITASRVADVLLQFVVSDTGIGIAPEAQGQLFESFAQADSSTARKYGGTGLGLAISRQLVILMGGEIGIESKVDCGSRFWFTLPLCVAAEPSEKVAMPPPWSILVAEESTIIRNFLAQNLNSWGSTTTNAYSTVEVLAALRTAAAQGRPFDLVITDVSFALAGGGELIRNIHSDYTLADTRTILMERFGSEVEAGITENWDVDAYLAKPLHLDRLRNCLLGLAKEGNCEFVEKPATTTEDAPLKPYRVLVVEDNATNQMVAVGMLEMIGCHGIPVASGREALEILRNERFDLILMDCNMPEMDGYETTAHIRVLEEELTWGAGQRIPIIAVTANTRLMDRERCLSAGMDDYLSKPFTLDGLMAKIHHWSGLELSCRPITLDVSTAPTNQYEPLDNKVLATLREALGDTFGQALQPFLEDTPVYLERLAKTLVVEDWQGVRQAAHAIKGSAGNLGAMHFSRLAKQLEDIAIVMLNSDSSSPTELEGHPGEQSLDKLREEYKQVSQVLVAEIQKQVSMPVVTKQQSALVLVVDDDRSTRAALRYALQRDGFRVDEACDGMQALAMVARIHPDVVLMDALMPVMDGFTACAKLQEMPGGAELPVIIVTALEDTGSIERAFTVGARDYIPKPLHLTVVNQRVRRIVENSQSERHVRRLAYNDTLTGLVNRLMFVDHLERRLAYARDNGQQLAVLFLDLDRFKYVNDTMGHDIGDRLLVSVARRIKHCVRDTDCVARFGGDEFTIALEDLANPAAATTTAQKVRCALTTPFNIGDQELFVSTSIGISVFPHDGTEVGTLLKHADTAMYRAKKNNTGYAFYEPEMESSLSAHLQMESALRHALERDELVMFYQPKAEVATWIPSGMEALIRWRHPQWGLVSPVEFIPIAEDTGLILPIGEWVLRTVCAQLKSWQDTGLPVLPVAVNLSGLQIKQPDLVKIVADILTETALEPRLLELEITESVLMEHAKETLATLHQLKEIGVTLAIDDFGTGYSSLSYLKRFPVDTLKIDRTFVHDVHTSPDDASIITSIIALAHSLRRTVVAEGVETIQQREFLVQAGCDYIQGYLLAKPLPAEEFERWLSTSVDRQYQLSDKV
ncbi:two-component system, sensor histidine kinase and response regulator [Gammaproteobacteria bacterium]